MAKLAFLTLTVFIALFFTICTSKPQHPLDLPNGDSASFHDPSITLPEPDSKRTILLPSEKPESEPATMVELEQNEKEIEASDMEILEEDREEVEEKKPEMRFGYRDLRSVWHRHEDQRMMFVLRHPHHHHRCHHPHRRPNHQHHQILFRQFDVERPEVEIGETERSYGNDMLIADPDMEKGFEEREGNLENDMLVADPEMEKFDDGALEQDLTEFRVADVGGRRHAPSRWVGFHFGGRPRFPDDPDHEHGPHHHHHHHHEDDEHRHEHEHRQDEDERRHHHPDEKRPFGGRREENGGGLVKRFRKFLHQIDF